MRQHSSPSTAKSKLPGMHYTHLIQAERYQIAILNQAGHDESEIARVMNRHPSTISREFRRNRGQRGSPPKQTHQFSRARVRARANGPRIADETCAIVDEQLGELWIPEQICGRLKARGLPRRTTNPSTNASTPTSETVAPCTAPCVVKRYAGNAMGVASDAAPSPTRCRSSSVRPSSTGANASVTGRG